MLAGARPKPAPARSPGLSMAAAAAAGAAAASVAIVASATSAPAAEPTAAREQQQLQLHAQGFRVVRLEDADRQNSKYMNEAAALLAAQWPKYGVDVRKRSLMVYLKERAAASAVALPCIQLLIEGESDTAMAHCKLRAVKSSGGQPAAAMVSVVVDPAMRGRGVGRTLVSEAEAAAAAAGCASMYLYVSTHPAACDIKAFPGRMPACCRPCPPTPGLTNSTPPAATRRPASPRSVCRRRPRRTG